ncbi:VOC family protein [Streptomyces sp. NPDC047108]|uniref:VOC family protein n=1 Tax=Streptomyces sp. NPDC047108 TaxID=3155025 RepID=UPI0033E09673
MAAFDEGVPCWVDVMVPDLEAGKRFYGELFGWTFQESEQKYGFYTWAFHDGRGVAALVPKPDGRMPTVWNLYFATRDADTAAARIEEAGGRIVSAPRPVGDFGATVMAADPGGAVFGLWEAGAHAGFEKRGRPVSYAWTDLYTRVPERADTFYETVFGYTTRQLDTGDGVPFAVWVPARQAGRRGGRGRRACRDRRQFSGRNARALPRVLRRGRLRQGGTDDGPARRTCHPRSRRHAVRSPRGHGRQSGRKLCGHRPLESGTLGARGPFRDLSADRCQPAANL